jgi:hypothetical protein
MNERRDSSSLRGAAGSARCCRRTIRRRHVRPRSRPRTACTSLSVRHRDPFGVGLSVAPEPARRAARRGGRTEAYADRPPDGRTHESRTRAHARVRPDARLLCAVASTSCPSAVVGPVRLSSQPCSLGPCASRSAMILFRALAGPAHWLSGHVILLPLAFTKPRYLGSIYLEWAKVVLCCRRRFADRE